MKRKLTATLAMMSLAFFAATAQNADENLSGLSVPLGYERLVGLAYRFVAGLVALHDFSAFLVDNQYVVVLI